MAPTALLSDRYVLGKLIGQGSYGRVYRAYDRTLRSSVALKVETGFSATSALANEAKVLRTLTKAPSPQGFAQYYHFSQEGVCQMLVMELLGKSLIDYLQQCGGQLTLKSTVLAAEQMLLRIEYVHSRGIIHQDVKPDNFVLGIGARQHHLYLIDFGLAKAYFGTSHQRISRQRGMVGTARYASLNAHKLLEQSRRDDLEALGYVLVYLLTGSLPWSGLKAESSSQKCHLVGECKRSTPLSELCKGCPEAFSFFVTHCRSLGFSERPDYDYLRGLLGDLREGLAEAQGAPIEDHEFEWNQGGSLGELEPIRWPSEDDDHWLQQPDDHHCRRKRDVFLGCVGIARGSVSRPTSNPADGAPAAKTSPKGTGMPKNVDKGDPCDVPAQRQIQPELRLGLIGGA